MRTLPDVTVVASEDCNCSNNSCLPLKVWLEKANCHDLHALYSGAIRNQSGYQLHDLMFSLYYKNPDARFFRNQMQQKFRELIEGELTVLQIKEQATLQTL